MRWPGKIVLALIVLIAILNTWRMAVHQTYNGPAAGQSDKIVLIPAEGMAKVSQTLEQAGVIAHPLVFQAASWWTRHDGPLRSGEYLFPAHASLRQILLILRHGVEVQHPATIPEGLTSWQIEAVINQLPVAKGHITPPAEGSVLPQTYDYVWGTTRMAILARMQNAMQMQLKQLWPARDPNIPLQTPSEAVTLASIVQQETPLASEMPMIAAVYENRLRLGMKLQADPTVIFAASHGQESAGLTITRADLSSDSPYNTYTHNGLPPGPICAPGLAALNAVLHPASSDALYFVAMNDGSHRSVFSHTLSQHLKNIQQFLDK